MPSRILNLLLALCPIHCGLIGIGLANAQEAPPPPKVHAERLTFDPRTEQWVVTATPIPGTEDGDLDLARQAMARANYEDARDMAEDWIKTYGPAASRYPEALYIQAAAQLELGDYRDAHENFQKLLNDFPGSDFAEQALSSEFRIAEQYLAGKKRKAFMGLFRVRDREAGLKIMDDMAANYADTPLAELAQKAKADYYYARGEFDLAQDEYATFAREYPRSRYHAYALLQSARSALASFPGIKFDDSGLIEAQERYTQFLQQYPDLAQQHGVSILLDEIAARRADKTYAIASFYDRTGQPGAARYYYRVTTQRWPGTPAAAQAEGRLAALGEPVAPGPAGLTEPLPAPQGGG